MPNLVVSVFAFLVVGVRLREFVNDRARQGGNVACTAVVIFVRPAGRVDKIGIRHPEQLRLVVHVTRKRGLGSGDMLGQSHAGIVPRLYDQSLEQILDRHLLANFDKHFRAFHTPGFFADSNHFIQRNVTIGNRLVDQISGHQLGNTGGLDMLVRILFRKHPARIEINQKIAGGVELRRIRYGLGSGPTGTGKQCSQDCNKKRDYLHRNLVTWWAWKNVAIVAITLNALKVYRL